MIVLDEILIENSGKTVVYNYSVDDKYAIYFNSEDPYFVEYEKDVSSVPKSILCVPFLVNFLPIAWFLDIDIQCAEVDKAFIESVIPIKKEFQRMYPEFQLKGNLWVEKPIVQENAKSTYAAMLFSGGVDAVSTLVRHADKKMALFSVWGADISLSEADKWNDLVNYNKDQNYLTDNPKYYIKSNLRSFYSYKLEQKLNIEWWGKVQHGMALLGVCAPLCHLLNITTLYIGSTHTKLTQISWGSNPVTDELLKWSNTSIVHECYDLTRLKKIESIIDYARLIEDEVQLRVCYSERRDQLNCSFCEKCLRTIMAIVLSGDNPNLYGFNVNESFYDLVKKHVNGGIKTKGVLNHWLGLQKKSLESENVYVFKDKASEEEVLKWFANVTLKLPDESKLKMILRKHKSNIINRFPGIFNFYMKFRLKLVK
ncbi:hypothetical protein [Carboxylicivirga sp. RSCT41]|uniref:hypothetical protein n=1 Tax=Carboxylicivirga agarovorans TaxID=3417570 RepID=UPI003D33BAB0